jgi:hypothetical protein
MSEVHDKFDGAYFQDIAKADHFGEYDNTLTPIQDKTSLIASKFLNYILRGSAKQHPVDPDVAKEYLEKLSLQIKQITSAPRELSRGQLSVMYKAVKNAQKKLIGRFGVPKELAHVNQKLNQHISVISSKINEKFQSEMKADKEKLDYYRKIDDGEEGHDEDVGMISGTAGLIKIAENKNHKDYKYVMALLDEKIIRKNNFSPKERQKIEELLKNAENEYHINQFNGMLIITKK